MPQENLYTQILDLDSLDVFLDTPVNDESYFTVRGLPEQIGYGKHFFTLTYKDPANQPLLATNSSIVFEFVDSNGTVIFSELADIPDTSGAATGYIWVKEDPLRSADKIFDGELTMTIVGTVTGVPDEWEGQRNLRSTFTFDIRKNKPNLSPIMIYDTDAIVLSSSFTETLEADISRGGGDISFNRGYINVSASHLQTQGGKIKFAELSYIESGSRTDQFTLLNTFDIDTETARFEVDKSGSQGINPVSSTFKTPIPKDIRRETTVKFKLRYLDENKSPAQYYDENRLNEQIVITSSFLVVDGTPSIIEGNDNLLRGRQFTGGAVGRGFEQSGRSSAYLKTVDYQGFKSASAGTAPGGVMFFSGSVLTSSGDEYNGVGLELFANTESFFKFRSDPSELDIRTKKFFVGSDKTQFLSASGGTIEISSSHFHLKPEGDVFFSGSIDASGGRIGGFEISSSRIQSTNRDLILKSDGQISASALLLASSSFQINMNNLSRFGTDDFQSFVMADDTGVRIQTSDFNLNTARFIISSSDVGVMAMGSTPPTNFDSGKGIYMSGDGEFLAGNSVGERIQFNGFNLVMSSSNFFLGNSTSFMSGSNGKIAISGSDVSIKVSTFFFGNEDVFISGSNGNMEISSSQFHLSRDGNAKLLGRIEAQEGFLGGFGITRDAITGSNIVMSGSPALGGTDHPRFMFISSSNFNVKENGDLTGSAVSFTGGTIGGFELSTTKINSTNDNLILKADGQITGSDVLFDGGKIAAFKISDDALSTDSFFISASATGTDLFISASSFNVSAKGVVTASALSLEGGAVGGLIVAEGTISVGDILKLKDSGQITGSNVLFTGGKISGSALDINVPTFFLGNPSNFVSGSNGQIKIQSSGETTLSGSGVNILTPQFLFGQQSTAFVSGSNGNIEISSSKFHVLPDGNVVMNNVTASNIKASGNISATTGTIGGFNIGTNLESAAGTLKLKGASGQITGSDVLFDGGKIAAFNLSTDALFTDSFFISASATGDDLFISSSEFKVKATGEITGSEVLFTKGKIAGWTIDGTTLVGANATLDGAGSALFKSDQGPDTDSGAAFDLLRDEYYIDFTPEGQDNTQNFFVKFGPNFAVDTDGILHASGAKFEGTISASKGIIGGFTTDGNSFHDLGNNIFISGSPATGGTHHPSFMFISSSNFNVKQNGDMTGSQVLFTGGKIGGFEFGTNTFTATNFELNPSDKSITLGSGTDIFIADGDVGIQLGHGTFSSAPFSVTKAGVLKSTSGTIGGFTIDADEIKAGSTLILDSDTNNGEIKLGAATSLIAGDGIYMNGSGHFRAGKALGQGIKFDGTNVIISSSAFNLGNADNFISGSTGNLKIFSSGETTLSGSGVNILTPRFFFGDASSTFLSGSTGKLEISSSKFHLSPDGNVVMNNVTASNINASGKIVATLGTIGGFDIDADEIKSTNLLLDSTNEKITVGSANAVTIQGGGTDNHIRMGSKTTFAQATTAGVILGMDSTVPTLEMFKDANNKFIFNGSGVEIKAATFDLATSTLILDSGTNNGKIALGGTPPTSITTNEGFYADGDGNVLIGDADGQRISFNGSNLVMSSSTFFLGNETNFVSGSNGQIKIQSSGETTLSGSGVNILTPRFMMGKLSTAFISGSNGNIEISSSAFHLDRNGNVTMSGSIVAQDGQIGGFAINPSTITATNFVLDPANKLISLGTGDTIFIADADVGIQLGDATFADAPFSVTKAGVLKSVSGTIGGFNLSATAISSSGLVLKSNGQITGSDVLLEGGKIAGFDIDGETLTATNFTLDADDRKITLGSSNNVIVADADVGIQIGHASFASAPFSVTKAGLLKATSGTIGGWNLGSDRLFSDNLNLTSTGTIETSNFASGVQGWRISAESNGLAEFENVKIRGTLSTTVFEKETVNAVGGQLYIANSTVLTGSTISASHNTMSVVNVSGFTGSYGIGGEILSLKKVTETGFTTEYVYVQSASRDDRSSDSNFAGKIFVIRGYSGSLPNGVDSSSLGDFASSAQEYNDGQVVVSTGRVDTGYIRLNANPSDSTTPYMDIVERTGSAIYDVDLKVRLGDLSGLSSARVGTSPGFGLFTERAFLTKDVTVGTLGSEHITVDSTSLRFIDNATTMAELRGDTWTVGGAHGDTSDTVVIDGDGVTIFGNDSDTGVFVTDNAVAIKANGDVEKVTLNNSGMTVTRDSVDVATFGVDTVIKGGTITLQGTTGGGNDDRLVIGSAAISLFTNDVKQVDINDSGINIGPAANAGAAVIGNISLTSGGAFIYGAATDDFVNVKSDGVDVVAGGVKQAFFGATSSLGNITDAHLSMSSAGVVVRDGATTKATFGSDITMQGGTITLNGESGTIGHDRVVIGSADISLFTNNQKKVHINDAGMNIGPAANAGNAVIGNVRLGSTGAYIYGAATDDYVFVKSDGVEVVAAGTEVAEFGAITTIGDVSTEHVRITSTALELKDGGTTHLSMSSAGLQIGSVANGITLDADGNAVFNGSISLPAGTVSASAQLQAAISGAFGADSASMAAQHAAAAIASASMATQVVLTSNGVDVQNADGSKSVASFGATVRVGEDANDKSRMVLDADSLDLIVDDGGTDTTFASFAATTTVGATGAEHISISSTGLDIKDNNTVRGVFNTHGATLGNPIGDAHISMSTSDLSIITGSNKAVLRSTGLEITQSNVGYAQFAATTTVGNTATEHIEVTSTTLKLKDGSTTRISMDSSGVQIGAVDSGITLNSDGDATFKGTLTIGDYLPAGTVSGSAQLADAISGSSNAVSASLAEQTAGTAADSASIATAVQLTSTGMNILNNSADKLAEFGSDVFVGLQDAEHVKISSAGLELKDDSTVVGKFVPGGATIGNPVGNAHISMSTDDISIITGSNKAVLRTTGLEITQSGVGYAQFAATTTIGNTATEHIELTNTTLKLKDGSTTRISMDSSGVQIGAEASGITLDSSGNATFKGALTIGGLVSGSAQLADAISGSSNAVSASLAEQTAGTAADSASMAAAVRLTATGMDILDGSNNALAQYGATVTIGQDANDKSRMVLGATSLDLIVDDGGTDTNFASFGAVTRIGDVANEHISMSSAGFFIKDGGTQLGKFVAEGVVIGDTSETHISASTTSVNVVAGGAVSASFGTTTTIGPTAGRHIKIDGDGFEIKTDATTTVLSASSAGLEMAGTVRANAGEIGGFTIDADEIKSTNILLDSTNEKITVGSSNAIKIQGGGTDNFIAMGSKSTFGDEGSGTAGILIGMDDDNPQAEFVKDANNYFIFDGGVDIKTDTLKASGSNIILSTPQFLLGQTSTAFVSGSNGVIEISSSKFHLQADGDVVMNNITASNAKISGDITITSGDLAGIDAASISGSSNEGFAATSADSASVAASMRLTATGMDILDGSGNAISQFGDTVTIGEDANDKSRMLLDADSLDLIVDAGGTDTTHASFGATTTIGDTSGEHISISSDAFEVKTDANTTVLSASSAGLFMSGSIAAGAGTIGPYDIDSTSLRRHNTDGTFNITSSLTANKFLLQANTASNHTDSRYHFDVSADDSNGINMGFLSADTIGGGTLDIDMRSDLKEINLKTVVNASSFTSAFTVAARPDRSLTEVVLSSGRNNLVSLNNESHPHIFTNTGKYGKQGFAMAQSGSHGTDPMAAGGDAFYLHMGTVSSSRASSISPITADYLQFEGNIAGMTPKSGQMSAAFSRHTTMQMFSHNHQDDHNTSTIYLPWHGTSENTIIAVDTVFVAPFWMRLEAVVYKPQNLTSLTPNLTVGLHNTRNNGNSIFNLDSVTITDTFADYTTKTARFTGNNRSIQPGQGALLSFDWSADAAGNINHHVTSVWTVAFDLDHLYDVTEG